MININQLDRLVAAFDPAAFKRTAAAVRSAGNKVIAAVHFGMGQGHLYENTLLANAQQAEFTLLTGMGKDRAIYDAYYQRTFELLCLTTSPVLLFEDPVFGLPDGAKSELQARNSNIISLPCRQSFSPRPRMDYAEGHPFRFNWHALRTVLSDLGVKMVDLVGVTLPHFQYHYELE